MQLKDAVLQILKENKKPLHFKTITQRIIKKRLYKFVTQTPQSSVAAVLYTSIKHDKDTPYKKIDTAVFQYNEGANSTTSNVIDVKAKLSAAAHKAWATKRAKQSSSAKNTDVVNNEQNIEQNEMTLKDALKIIDEQKKMMNDLIFLITEREKQIDGFKNLIDIYSKSFSLSMNDN